MDNSGGFRTKGAAMDTSMAISGKKIRALRDARAWSQAHLAEAASLSLRTVQRVEAEGTASAETRLAIAAALGVSVAELNAPAPVAEAAPARAKRADPGPLNTALMLSNIGFALVYLLWLGRGLPPEVASHFGVAGDANDTMTRDGFVASMAGVTVVLPSLLWGGMGWAMKLRLVNIPHADYWFAEPRRPATERYLYRHVTWLCIGLTAFMAWIFWLVAAADAGSPAHPVLDSRLATLGLGGFLAATTAWIVTLSYRFGRQDA
jgi:transcriptional regulator with XRE-family HTH domain